MSRLSREVFHSLIFNVDAMIRTARLKFRYAGFFERRRRRDELLNEIGYGVQTLLRATAHLYAQGIEARRAETGNTDSVHESPVAESDAPKGGKSHDQ